MSKTCEICGQIPSSPRECVLYFGKIIRNHTTSGHSGVLHITTKNTSYDINPKPQIGWICKRCIIRNTMVPYLLKITIWLVIISLPWLFLLLGARIQHDTDIRKIIFTVSIIIIMAIAFGLFQKIIFNPIKSVSFVFTPLSLLSEAGLSEKGDRVLASKLSGVLSAKGFNAVFTRDEYAKLKGEK